MPEDVLPLLAARVGEALLRQQLRLATAESCTGGWISKLVTDIPGSSDWFDRGFVTYSNAAKSDMLGVEPTLIDRHGAVSESVASAMAEGALARSDADFTIAVTGVAGPSGGTAEKPVGLVWLAWARRTGGGTVTERHIFSGDRAVVRGKTVQSALEGLLRLLVDA